MSDSINPVDFGEDFDDQSAKDGRSRTWMILLYEDDPTHKPVLDERLADLDWNYAGIKHDMDNVKEHYHIVCLFKDGRKNVDIAKDLGIDKRWLRSWDRKKKALRYLCHRDNPEKYQYSTDGIFGTIAEQAVSACSKGNELSEAQAIQEIVSLLNEIDGFVSYSFFLGLVAERGLYPVFRRLGIIATRLIDEHNGIVRSKIDKEIKEQSRLDELERFLKISHDIPFTKLIEVLEKNGLIVNDQNSF